MVAFLGWQLTLAEFVGAPIMVGLLILIFRWFLNRELLEEAKAQADRGVKGRMEDHAEMDMSVTEGGSLWQRLTSERGLTAISHYFVMDWASVWLDIVGGLLIAGALAAWVPDDFWRSFFIVDHPLLATLWGPIVGPLVAVISFVCSVGNIPLAAVLWNGGISFGGVIAFIFAELIVSPDSEYLSQILWMEDGSLSVRDVLRCDVYSGAGCRVDFRDPWSCPGATERARSRGFHHLGLHDLAQRRLSHSRGLAGWAIPKNGQARDVAHDEQTGRDGAHPLGARPDRGGERAFVAR
jgi:hypothetical protein